MMKRQRPSGIRVLWRYVDRLEAVRKDRREDVMAERKLADLALDGDLPNAGSAHDDAVARIANGVTSHIGKTTIMRIPPNEYVSIEQKIHVRDRGRRA